MNSKVLLLENESIIADKEAQRLVLHIDKLTKQNKALVEACKVGLKCAPPHCNNHPDGECLSVCMRCQIEDALKLAEES